MLLLLLLLLLLLFLSFLLLLLLLLLLQLLLLSPKQPTKNTFLSLPFLCSLQCSRQTLMEKLGKTSRTVDVELEGQIEALRDTQRKYANILRLARALTSHFYHVVQTQVNKAGRGLCYFKKSKITLFGTKIGRIFFI